LTSNSSDTSPVQKILAEPLLVRDNRTEKQYEALTRIEGRFLGNTQTNLCGDQKILFSDVPKKKAEM